MVSLVSSMLIGVDGNSKCIENKMLARFQWIAGWSTLYAFTSLFTFHILRVSHSFYDF